LKIEVELPEGPDWVKETLEEAMAEALAWTERKVLAREAGKKLTVGGASEPPEAILGRIAATRDLILAVEGRYEGLVEERMRALEEAHAMQPEA
jgi:hypothetical protein